MTGTVRVFLTEDAAHGAAAALGDAGFEAVRALTPSSAMGREFEAVRDARDAGLIPSSAVGFARRALSDGRSVVAVNAPFGRGLEAENLMESRGAVDSARVPAALPHDPAPFSNAFDLPLLTEFRSSTELLSSRWSFSALIGMKLLSKNPTPFSSMLAMPVLSKGGKGAWTKSFGLPLLSRNPAPFSSLFGMSVLTKRRERRDTSFGFHLLWNNPAPLSSVLRLPVLTRD